MVAVARALRIGVDVGGTNTDAVVLDLSPGAKNPVLAAHKSSTTADVTTGIQKAVEAVLLKSEVDPSHLQAIAIGTTSFVNSLIERNAEKLERVAVVRLCGPHSRLSPPFSSFPYELRAILEGPAFFAAGGLQVDGREIESVDPKEIGTICAEIRRQGIKTVAVSSIYAPIDHDHKQEETARELIRNFLPEVKVSISKEVANIGLLQRENATILNAALLSFASSTIKGFQASTAALDLTCPLFLTSNDGTLMTCEQAEKFPIKTFSSGPTNSMRGANFLASLASGGQRKETALVVDIGGTTTEIGALLPTGFPRQAGASHELCGVSLNFSMPHVLSIGLGGGSKVRIDQDGKTTVGPDSVGYRIDQARAFGGEVLTATDIVVAAGRAPHIGDASLVKDLDLSQVEAAQARMKVMLELALDSMKTSTQDIPVYLVGGGAILAPDTLKGISKVHRFPYYDAANAVGAACAQISAVIDTFEDTTKVSMAEMRHIVEQRAIKKAIAAGADPIDCKVVESEAIPIAYTAGRCRFYVKAAGEWTADASIATPKGDAINGFSANGYTDKPLPRTTARPCNQELSLPTRDVEWTAAAVQEYKPTVKDGEWILSEIDVEWMATGCYILGCGGGGSPHPTFLALRNLIRSGAVVRVIDLAKMEDGGKCIWGGGIGSPEVSAERLTSADYNDAVLELIKFLRIDNLVAMAALEIGGGNGLINMIAGASNLLDLPIIDGDFMGRAYPTGWQTTPNVYDKGNRGEMLLPAAMCSGDGNTVFMTSAKHYLDCDSVMRAACVDMGTHAGAAQRPLTKAECELSMVKNTVSQSWRIGRAVALAQKQGRLGSLGSILIESMGGRKAAKVLFEGKIVDVGRRMYKGHTVGEVVIQALARDEEEEDDPEYPKKHFEGSLVIPFKNENLYAEHRLGDKSTIIAGVPDLISVVDAGSGYALGTPDYKYGLKVLVLGITAAPQWTDTQRGLDIGALPAFGYDIPYKPIGTYVKPLSVIEEFA